MYCFFCCSDEILITLRMTLEGQKKNIPLCSLCAAERGITRQKEGVLLDYDELSRCLEEFSCVMDRQACPGCGTTRESVLKRGVTGCPECFNVFRDDLLSILQGEPEERRNLRIRIDSLRQNLEGLVKHENYEAAVELRDKINKLKEQLNCNPE